MQLKKFVNKSQFGDRHVYHTGSLSNDRQKDSDLNDTAKEALELYQKGLIELIQKKIGKNNYQYIAVRTETERRYFSGCYK